MLIINKIFDKLLPEPTPTSPNQIQPIIKPYCKVNPNTFQTPLRNALPY